MSATDLEEYFQSVLNGNTTCEPPPMNTTFQLPQSIKSHDDIYVKLVNWDVHQQQSLLLALTNSSVVPIHVTGQGYCVLPAISKCLWGTEAHHNFLLAKVSQEIRENMSWYQSITTPEQFQIHLQELNEGTKLRFFHLLALSNILARPILIYAPPELVTQFGEGHGGVAASLLPTRLGSQACRQFPIALAVSPTPKLVYVPLVPLEGCSFTWPPLPPAFPATLRTDESPADYFRNSASSFPTLHPPPMQLILENTDRLSEYASRRVSWGKANPETYISTVRDLKAKYDLVWQIEMGGGEQRFICYNVGDDPVALARKFAHVEHLNESQFLQILEFIRRQIDRAKRDPSTMNMFLPGYNRQKTKAPTCQHFPYMGDMVSYSQAKFPAILKKITEFNSLLKTSNQTSSLAISDPELVKLTSIASKLETGIPKNEPSVGMSLVITANASALVAEDFALLKKLLVWPHDKLFPVLDLIRMVADNTQCISFLQSDYSLIQSILGIGKLINSGPAGDAQNSKNPSQTAATNMFLILKTIVNVLRKDAKRVIVRKFHTELFDVFEIASRMHDKNVCSSLASAMLNYSLLEREARQFTDPWATILLATLNHADEPESAFKCLVALGSLLVKEFEIRHQVNLPRDEFDFVVKKFTKFNGQNGAEKIQQCVADLQMLLLPPEETKVQ